jgi:hypothetical protein
MVDFVGGPISQREVNRHDVEWLHTVIQLKEIQPPASSVR